MDSVWRWSPLGNGEGKDTLIYINICLNIWHTLTNEYLSIWTFYLFGFDNSILSLQGFKKIILNHGDILQNSAPCHGDISLRKWRIHIWSLVGYCDRCECARTLSTGGRGFRQGPIVIGHLRSRDCGYCCFSVKIASLSGYPIKPSLF